MQMYIITQIRDYKKIAINDSYIYIEAIYLLDIFYYLIGFINDP